MFKGSLFIFATECLGYDKLYEPHEKWCADFQRMYLEYEEKKPGYRKRALRLMPRGCYKSTIFTVSAALWMLTRDPNLRILLFCGKEGNAKNFLHEIKKHITQNGKFRSCFGKWDEGADRWTTTDILIGTRTLPRKEPTLLAIGKGSEITSLHFDVALVDDLVTREDRDSTAAREASRMALQDLESIMDGESIVSVVGTHWHFDDAYMWIRNELNPKLEAEGKQTWETHVETPYEADGHTERFSRIIPDLEDLKIKRGLTEYYANYMNNPLPPDTQLFNEGTLTYFQFSPEAYAARQKYGYWDPASTKPGAGKDPDFHSIVIIARVDTFYDVIDVWMKQEKPSAGYKQAVELARAYDLTHLRVETNHIPDGADNLEVLIRKAGLRTGVSGIKNTANKAARIETLEPLTTAGRIRFRTDWRECSNHYRLFMEQLTMYPVASHDDGPDALEGCYQIAVAGGRKPAEAQGGAKKGQGQEQSDTDLDTAFIDSIWSRYGTH